MPPTPGGAYLGRDVPGGRVSVIAGLMLITEFRGAMLPYILSADRSGIHAQLTWVNGRPGVYGSSVRRRAPGDVLTWLQGPLTLRIEGAEHARAGAGAGADAALGLVRWGSSLTSSSFSSCGIVCSALTWCTVAIPSSAAGSRLNGRSSTNTQSGGAEPIRSAPSL